MQLATEAAEAPSPRAALRLLGDLRREIEAFERRTVSHALADGATYADLARDLGRSRQAVHRRFRAVAGDDAPLLLAPEVADVLRYAREEAAAVHATELRGEHLLPAVLRADVRAAGVLRAAGATLERARTHLDGASVRGGLFGREVATGDPRALLAAAADVTRARGGQRIEIEDVLRAALAGSDSGAARALRALGVDPDAVSAELAPR